MTAFYISIGVIVLFSLIYLFVLKGRTGHADLPKLQGWHYAHRGLHGEGIPENSLAAFRAAKEGGYGIELDVHLMKDGNLAVIHDASLKRTAGADVTIEELTVEDLENYRLEGTDEKIPLFSQVLELYAGAAPLIVELKSAGKNVDALCRVTCDMLAEYDGAYCLESFDPRCISWLRKNRPHLIRGQLSENFFKSKTSKLPWFLKLLMKYNFFNLTGRPDFVAYKFVDRKNISIFICQKIWKLQVVAWTIRTPEDQQAAVNEGWLSIFEKFKA